MAVRVVIKVPVGDCSTKTPDWLDVIARRIGSTERAWMERRIAELEATVTCADLHEDPPCDQIHAVALEPEEERELFRLRAELRTGYRGSLSYGGR